MPSNHSQYRMDPDRRYRDLGIQLFCDVSTPPRPVVCLLISGTKSPNSDPYILTGTSTMTYDFSAVDELADPSIGLSTEALSALTEFLAEQKEQDDAFMTLRKAAAHQSYQASEAGSEITNSSAASTRSDDEVDQISAKLSLSMRIFKEDWQLSQFWYDEETAKIMSEELLSRANGGMIACISAPTVFLYLKVVSLRIPCLLACHR